MIQIPTSALRKAGGRTILQTAADLGVALSLIFWLMVFTVVLLPRAWPTDTMSALTAGLMVLFIGALALCQAVVVPALVATVLPGTSAGMLLQEHQRRTWGFVVLVPSAGFLVYVSWYMLTVWWAAQPAVVEAGMVTQLTVMSMVFFIVVPGWIWSSSSPAAWMAEVEQAQAVKRLRLTHEAELASMKAMFARAIGLMELGLDRCTLEQRQYVGQSINAIHRYRNEQLRQVGRHIGTLMGIDEGLPWSDATLTQHLDTVLRAVAANEMRMPDDAAEEPPREATPPAATARHGRHEGASAHAREVANVTPTPTGDRDPFFVAREHFGDQPFTRREVQELFSCQQSKALDMIKTWRADGLLHELAEPKHTYQFRGY